MEATERIRRLTANGGTLCFEVVGGSKDGLQGVELLNGMGRAVRNGCVVLGMQKEDEVRTVRGLIEDPWCLWLQVDVGGGRWAPKDAHTVVDDGYVVAGSGDGLKAGVSGTAVHPPVPLVVLSLWEVAQELGTCMSDDDGDSDSDSDSDVHMWSSPLVVRVARRVRGAGLGSAGPGVGLVGLFPVAPALPAMGRRSVCGGTIADSVEGGDSEFEDGLWEDDFDLNDPACGGGGGLAGTSTTVRWSWGT